MKNFIAEGYLNDDILQTNKIRRLFVCENEKDTISKTNISTALNKNFTISLNNLEKLLEESKHQYDEIYLVGEVFSIIDMETFEDLKSICLELWSLDEEYFIPEEILKY